ncbi:MAG TPA: hypothetical protein VJS38_05510 [Phenylobacterium sp.]|uniref:hypothetical protein n=1 Tax=Phenylobacterium sp. TaxID=1871053 RepID=UPI002B4A5A02|nr:hypothetical protein [Phenylobacterium sp.]HKR87613.1 hypothetical protein [Phenylobacterium sp.]
MKTKASLLSGAAILVGCTLWAAGPADAAVKHHKSEKANPNAGLAAEVQALKEQVQALTATVQQQQAQVQASTARADEASAQAQAAQAKLDDQIQRIPDTVKTEVAAQPAPTLDKLKYKGVSVQLGGFLAAEGIYRNKNIASDISSSFAKIPFENAPLSRSDETRFTARQSRLSFLAQGDINKVTHVAMYGEFDFQGAAQTANSNESNSYNPRIRNLYGTIDWDYYGWHVLAGQNWSLVTLNSKGITPRNEVPPPSIDAQYVPGFAWARQPQLRVTKDFADKSVWLAASLENPQSTFAGTAGNQLPTGVSVIDLATGNTTINGAPAVGAAFSGFNSVNTSSLNRIPDVIVKAAWEPYIGLTRPLHVEAFGIYRSFYDTITVTSANTQGLTPGTRTSDVSGAGFGAGVTYTVVPKLLDVQASMMSGKGIGRYGSSQLPDATLKPDGEIAPIQETMFLAGATLHATPNLDLYLFGGKERANDEANRLGNTFYGFGNLSGAAFTAAGCTTVGGSCSATVRQVSQITAGLWDKAYTGSFGQVRLGLQYSHTMLDGFSGGGYTPHTSADMVFTSFRYYPF